MRWIIHSEQRCKTVALEFCREFAGNYVTSKLDWIRIDLGRGRKSGAPCMRGFIGAWVGPGCLTIR